MRGVTRSSWPGLAMAGLSLIALLMQGGSVHAQAVAAQPGSAPSTPATAPAQTLTVAAYPAVDEIVRAAIPAWKRRHPTIDIRVISRQFADHHTAMTTAP